LDRLRVLTWHIHGSYLFYLTHSRQEFYLPVKAERSSGYGGRTGTFPWPENLHEIPADEVRNRHFDCVLFQSQSNYLKDQYEILSEAQRQLPRVYLEHDPPRESPTDTRHPVDDPNMLLVHVTHFNRLMWDSGRTPTQVIEHGVTLPDGARYTGEIDRGIAVVNNLASRGRRLGRDIFEELRTRVPLDLIGMGSEELGGLGEIKPPGMTAFAARYRFFFNPIRYTSLGLAVCEAMMAGMPIVGLATTEMSTVIENGFSGFVDTDPERLTQRMLDLLGDQEEAHRLGANARRVACERFNIWRFARDWDDAFSLVTGRPRIQPELSALGETA
jgi:glycosyltransferase involved in cell wall biosynthesis